MPKNPQNSLSAVYTDEIHQKCCDFLEKGEGKVYGFLRSLNTRFNISTRDIQSGFKKRTEMTMSDYRIETRVPGSKNALKDQIFEAIDKMHEQNGQVGANTLMHHAGYEDYNMFNQHFIQMTGKTPQQFRDENFEAEFPGFDDVMAFIRTNPYSEEIMESDVTKYFNCHSDDLSFILRKNGKTFEQIIDEEFDAGTAPQPK